MRVILHHENEHLKIVFDKILSDDKKDTYNNTFYYFTNS
jgi:hypothetical protein